jgi:hypothetical protein
MGKICEAKGKSNILGYQHFPIKNYNNLVSPTTRGGKHERLVRADCVERHCILAGSPSRFVKAHFLLAKALLVSASHILNIFLNDCFSKGSRKPVTQSLNQQKNKSDPAS